MKINELNGLYIATNDDDFKILVASAEESKALDIARKYFADSALSSDKISIAHFEDVNTVFDCDHVITGADEMPGIKSPVVTVEFLLEDGRREEGYTITGNIGEGALLQTVQNCIDTAYQDIDIIEAEKENDEEYLTSTVPEEILKNAKEKGKTFAEIGDGYYNFFEGLLEIMGLQFEKTAPAVCDITEWW